MLFTVDKAMVRKGVSRMTLINTTISVVCSHNGRPDESPAFLFVPPNSIFEVSAPRTGFGAEIGGCTSIDGRVSAAPAGRLGAASLPVNSPNMETRREKLHFNPAMALNLLCNHSWQPRERRLKPTI
jgi:hypothetical protein